MTEFAGRRAHCRMSRLAKAGEPVISGAVSVGAVSYDLILWRQDQPLAETPGVIYQRLSGGTASRGLPI